MRSPAAEALLFFLFCSTVCAVASASSWRFDHQIVYVGLDGPDDVVNADIDGDGRMDILCSEGNIHWFEKGVHVFFQGLEQ